MKISALIAAAGSASRFGSQKLLEDLNGKTVIETTISKFQKVDLVNEIIICTSENIFSKIETISKKFDKVSKVILGGNTRQETVYKGLLELENTDIVAIHDGARPLITPEIITNTISEAIKHGHATCAVSVKDTIKIVDKNKIINTPERNKLYQIQTPQVFKLNDIIRAHKKYINEISPDDTFLLEKNGNEVFIVKGCYSNIKITTPEDIEIARVLEKSSSN